MSNSNYVRYLLESLYGSPQRARDPDYLAQYYGGGRVRRRGYDDGGEAGMGSESYGTESFGNSDAAESFGAGQDAGVGVSDAAAATEAAMGMGVASGFGTDSAEAAGAGQQGVGGHGGGIGGGFGVASISSPSNPSPTSPAHQNAPEVMQYGAPSFFGQNAPSLLGFEAPYLGLDDATTSPGMAPGTGRGNDAPNAPDTHGVTRGVAAYGGAINRARGGSLRDYLAHYYGGGRVKRRGYFGGGDADGGAGFGSESFGVGAGMGEGHGSVGEGTASVGGEGGASMGGEGGIGSDAAASAAAAAAVGGDSYGGGESDGDGEGSGVGGHGGGVGGGMSTGTGYGGFGLGTDNQGNPQSMAPNVVDVTTDPTVTTIAPDPTSPMVNMTAPIAFSTTDSENEAYGTTSEAQAAAAAAAANQAVAEAIAAMNAEEAYGAVSAEDAAEANAAVAHAQSVQQAQEALESSAKAIANADSARGIAESIARSMESLFGPISTPVDPVTQAIMAAEDDAAVAAAMKGTDTEEGNSGRGIAATVATSYGPAPGPGQSGQTGSSHGKGVDSFSSNPSMAAAQAAVEALAMGEAKATAAAQDAQQDADSGRGRGSDDSDAPTVQAAIEAFDAQNMAMAMEAATRGVDTEGGRGAAGHASPGTANSAAQAAQAANAAVAAAMAAEQQGPETGYGDSGGRGGIGADSVASVEGFGNEGPTMGSDPAESETQGPYGNPAAPGPVATGLSDSTHGTMGFGSNSPSAIGAAVANTLGVLGMDTEDGPGRQQSAIARDAPAPPTPEAPRSQPMLGPRGIAEQTVQSGLRGLSEAGMRGGPNQGPSMVSPAVSPTGSAAPGAHWDWVLADTPNPRPTPHAPEPEEDPRWVRLFGPRRQTAAEGGAMKERSSWRELLAKIYGDEDPRDTYRNPLTRSPKSDPWRAPSPEGPPPREARSRDPGRPDAVTAPVSRTLAEAAVGTARAPYDVPHDLAQAISDILQQHYAQGIEGGIATAAGMVSPVPARVAKPKAPRLPELRPSKGDWEEGGIQTVSKPYRKPLFDIYGDPRKIIEGVPIAPDTGAMKEVFGGIKDPQTGERFTGTREGLAEIGGHGTREGNMREPEKFLKFAKNPKGSEAAEKVMTPRNEQRIHDILTEAGKIPGLRVGMDNWYVMDPMYWRMVELFGPEEAKTRYNHLNHMISLMSPGSEVMTEIPRGVAAHFLDQQGRFQDFQKHGGLSAFDPNNPKHYQTDRKTKQLLLDQHGNPIPKPAMADLGMSEVPGHIYHSTSQALPMSNYVMAGRILDMDSPKVPSYIYATGVPAIGFQTRQMVPDAHWSRGVGLADTRHGPSDITASATMPEAQMLGPWWRDRIAAEHGIEAVPAQARFWGALSGKTGVDTPIGAPKLELVAEYIKRRAAELGWPVDVTRDMILSGDMYALGGVV